MRTYIFTELERKTIQRFLNDSISRSDPNLMNILSRIRLFRNLSSDVELYVRLREPKSAGAT